MTKSEDLVEGDESEVDEAEARLKHGSFYGNAIAEGIMQSVKTAAIVGIPFSAIFGIGIWFLGNNFEKTTETRFDISSDRDVQEEVPVKTEPIKTEPIKTELKAQPAQVPDKKEQKVEAAKKAVETEEKLVR